LKGGGGTAGAVGSVGPEDAGVPCKYRYARPEGFQLEHKVCAPQ